MVPSASIQEKAYGYVEITSKNLSEIVNIPSLSGDEEMVINRLQEMLFDSGFDDIRVDGLGNLIGRVGDGPKKLAIDAHIDTVDTGDPGHWEHNPLSGKIVGGEVYGRGSVDQKGGAASMVTAGRILKDMNYSGEYSIYFTFTIMEEDCDGLCWNYLIEKEKLIPDYAVITEPTNLAVHRGHRGRMELDLLFSGLSAHGSAPERGDNAIYKAAYAVLEIDKLNTQLEGDDFLGKGTIAVTDISSTSPSLCAIPDRCGIHLDRRLTWGETMEGAVNEVLSIIKKNPDLSKTSIRVPNYNRKSYLGTLFEQRKYYPTWKLPEEHALVQAGIETCCSLFGEEPVIGNWTFSTNGVALCGKHGIPTIGYGPGDEIFAHAPNERVPVAHLESASAFYALLPYMLEEKSM